MHKLIIIFHDFDGKLVKRTVTHIAETAIITIERAITRNFSASLYQQERDNTYTATVQWEGTRKVDIYNYLPARDVQWKWEDSYQATK